MTRTLTAKQVREDFKKAAKEAADESDYVSSDEAEAIIQRHLSKIETEGDDDEEDGLDSELLDDGTPVEFTDEELEAALPDDIYEAVRAHLEGDGGRDSYLEAQGDDIDKAARQHQSEVEGRMHARAEAVAEGEAEVPLHEATELYSDGEEGV